MENKTPNTPNKPTGRKPKFNVSWYLRYHYTSTDRVVFF